MPRVNYCSTKETELELLTKVLREACYREAGSVTAAAYIVDISPTTWRRKVANPEKMQVEELIRVAKRLNISKTKLMGIIERMM